MNAHDQYPQFETQIVRDRPQIADICIVIIGYNRPDSLARLLRFVASASYGTHMTDLIVSIDKGSSASQVASVAQSIEWPYGNYSIRIAKKNLGLRKHVLACGAITEKYEAIIMLEDDLIIGPDFLNYVRAAIKTYDGNDNIAGISLYAPEINEMANLPFLPAYSIHSVYALQSTQSWGQCWTRRMWSQFESWYRANNDDLVLHHDMPARIYSWPDSSWKKYAMKYLAVTGRTWIYPYHSFSSNCSEVGTHNQIITTLFQTRLSMYNSAYKMPALESLISYDIFFERNASVFDSIKPDNSLPITIDLYATKKIAKAPGYLLTTNILSHDPIQSYTMTFKPHETGVLFGEMGNHVRLYQLDDGDIQNQVTSYNRMPALYANLEWRDALKYGISGFINAIWQRLK